MSMMSLLYWFNFEDWHKIWNRNYTLIKPNPSVWRGLRVEHSIGWGGGKRPTSAAVAAARHSAALLRLVLVVGGYLHFKNIMMGRGCEVNVPVWYFSDLERAANRCLHRQMEVTSPGLCLYLHSDLTTQNMTRYCCLNLHYCHWPKN